MTAVAEVVSTYCLERVDWSNWRRSLRRVGGAFGWDGAMRLHAVHRARVSSIAGVIPGQNNESSARDTISDTPW